MSFQDVEAGLSNVESPARSAQSPEEAAFANSQSSLSLQVFKIDNNVRGILKLVDLFGTQRDSPALRKSLHDLTNSTWEMVKRGSEDLKKLAALQLNLPRQRDALRKTSHDLQLALSSFQRAQQVCAERQRTAVEGVKIAVEEEQGEHRPEHDGTVEQRQAQIFQTQLSSTELALQEALILERDAAIRDIEAGIHEFLEILKDLGPIVRGQGEMIDDIRISFSSVAVDASGAAEELTTTHEYQRKVGRRAACLGVVLIVVVLIVLLAVFS